MIIRAIILLLAITQVALAQHVTNVAVTGDRLSGFVIPIEPVKSDLVIDGTRAFAWKVDDTRRLVVQGDVRVTVGAYSFATKKSLCGSIAFRRRRDWSRSAPCIFRKWASPVGAPDLECLAMTCW